MKNLLSVLQKRGFIDAFTSEELREACDTPLKIYSGFDPTADSLHLGNFVPIMALAWCQKFGHTPIALLGGATGRVGDPSGKSVERPLLEDTVLATNLMGIRRSLEAVLKKDILIVDNYEWFKELSFLDFLRDIGKHFRLGTMLGKEGVRTRLASEEGMSYTEFSYQLLQAYDFVHLFDTYGVTVQIGGSDQWGNITAGTELLRKLRGKTVHGMTFPLLTRSDGKKFGKSEEGAIWLNADKLPVYDFYQYLFRMPDADLPKLFRMLTFLELEEIEEIEASMKHKDYVANTAQRRLAQEVTRIVHGQEGVLLAEKITEVAKPGSHTVLDKATLEALSKEIPSITLPRNQVLNKKLLDLLIEAELVASKGEARRTIIHGGAYLNNEKIVDEQCIISEKHFIEGCYLLLGFGKKKKTVIKIT